MCSGTEINLTCKGTVLTKTASNPLERTPSTSDIQSIEQYHSNESVSRHQSMPRTDEMENKVNNWKEKESEKEEKKMTENKEKHIPMTDEKKEEFDYNAFQMEFQQKMETKEYKECEEMCIKAINQYPSNEYRAKLHNLLGYLFENWVENDNNNNKSFDDILEHYVMAIQIDDTCVVAHLNLANFLVEQGSLHFARALELDPTHKEIKPRLNLLHANLLIGHDWDREQVRNEVNDTKSKCMDTTVGNDEIPSSKSSNGNSMEGKMAQLQRNKFNSIPSKKPLKYNCLQSEHFWPLILFIAALLAICGIAVFIGDCIEKGNCTCVNKALLFCLSSVVPLTTLTMCWSVHALVSAKSFTVKVRSLSTTMG